MKKVEELKLAYRRTFNSDDGAVAHRFYQHLQAYVAHQETKLPHPAFSLFDQERILVFLQIHHVILTLQEGLPYPEKVNVYF